MNTSKLETPAILIIIPWVSFVININIHVLPKLINSKFIFVDIYLYKLTFPDCKKGIGGTQRFL